MPRVRAAFTMSRALPGTLTRIVSKKSPLTDEPGTFANPWAMPSASAFARRFTLRAIRRSPSGP